MVEDTTAEVDPASPGAELPRWRYNEQLANTIELKWQRRWAEEGTFHAPNPSGSLSAGWADVADRPKLYVLDMFPYPSGVGLHVGHPLGYIGSDVYARFSRMTGRNVMHVMGFDAFGLPAEQYAVQTGQHPRITTDANIDNMRRQLTRLGLGHDERRSVATTDPAFFQWTQWIFLQIYNSWYDEVAGRARPIDELVREFDEGKGLIDDRDWAAMTRSERGRVLDRYRLVYLDDAPVNWCPALGTVLANEEVTAEGRSERGNHPVFRRRLRQWKMRITAYADRLVADLDHLDWPQSIKLMQRNWIGPSTGARVRFEVPDRSATIEVFTTRPDTLFGATFMIVAPENPLADALVAPSWPSGTPEAWTAGAPTPAAALATYQRQVGGVRDVDRLAATREKTGVFTGSWAINPVNGTRLPVFVSDYVLAGYGTGSIMAVPAHSSTDFQFAVAFALPLVRVVEPPARWFADAHIAPDAAIEAWPDAYEGDGIASSSANAEVSLDGLSTAEAKARIVDWLERAGHGHGTTNYRLRDWLFSRQRYWGEPFPIVFDEDDQPVALPESMLPVALPDLDNYEPEVRADDDDSIPEPPLARATEWLWVTLDLGDGPKRFRRETNTMPQWAGSCWYYLRYLDPDNEAAMVGADIERYWMRPPAGGVGGVDFYIGGVEHAVLHLLYARFWHKVLYDLGHVSTPEPFHRLYNQGYIQAAAYTDERGVYVESAEVDETSDGFVHRGRPVTREYGKMGKSLKNSVTPDEIYAAYGADTLRLYEMFTGPLDASRPWETRAIVGVYRFLQRVWRLLVDEDTGEARVADVPLPDADRRVLHQTIDQVRRGLERLRFNTSISRLIELTTHLTGAYSDGAVPREAAESLVLMLSPLAPHVGEELWARLGHGGSLVREPFPLADPAMLAVATVKVPVQVNGKVRATIEVAADIADDDLASMARSVDRVAAHLEGHTERRVVVIPGRLVNFVVD